MPDDVKAQPQPDGAAPEAHEQHYLRSLGRLGDARHVIVAQPIYSSTGVKLLDAGATVSSRTLERLGRAAFDPAQTELRAALLRAVTSAGLEGRATKQLAEGEDGDQVAALLRLLETDGFVTEIEGMGFVTPAALADLQKKIRTWFGSGHEVLTPQDFKELTGLTRKAAIPLLEWLDKKRLTQRRGDHRIAGPLAR